MILVTGGGGYTGSVLVPLMLQAGFQVKVVDAFWFGHFLAPHKNLTILEMPYEQLMRRDLDGVESVIHLANIANDPSVELSPNLSWEVNVLHTKHLLDISKKARVRKFLYASSGSVYGVKQELKVTEDLDLVPVSTYNKTKMIAERVVKSYSSELATFNIRPATVCGYSPRMRFDVVVNMFVKQAIFDRCIKVFGGDQVRPNIHIQDLARVYIDFISKDLEPGEYNAGFENLSIASIANLVREKVDCDIVFQETVDVRSYKQDSQKLLETGFRPQLGVTDAIDELVEAISKGNLYDDPRWYTVSWMQKLGIQKV